MANSYDQELKERALRLLAKAMPEHDSVHAASKHIGGLLRDEPLILEIQRIHAQNFSVYGSARCLPS